MKQMGNIVLFMKIISLANSIFLFAKKSNALGIFRFYYKTSQSMFIQCSSKYLSIICTIVNLIATDNGIQQVI